MAIRTIKWLVDSNGKTISPTRVQDGGVQGDHNATRAEFLLPSSFADGFTLYIEYVDAAGGYDKTDPLEMELTTPPDSYGAPYKVCAPLPLAWTQLGGTATLRLVATKGNGDTDTETTYTLEGKVRYQPRAGIVGKVDSLVRGCIQEAMDKLTDSLESVDEHINKADEKLEIVLSDAQSSAADAQSAAERASEAAQNAQTAAEQVGDVSASVDALMAIQQQMLAGKQIAPADHIIEQGTVGVWTYRKWASGIAEAWCLTGAKDVSNFTASGSIYISPMLTETLPEGVFTEVTCPTVQVRELGAYVVNGCLFYSNANRIEWQVFRHWNDSNTYRLWFYIDVKGRWL